MPAADAATVRMAAARAAELAGELRRVHAALHGSMGQAGGWSGTAELAFQDSVSAQLSQFAPAVQRYEGYAAAFGRYAAELDLVEPPLRAARSRLVNAEPAPLGGGAPSCSAAVAEFQRYWANWDTARTRCAAALAAVGEIDADPRRHGWSRLLHELTSVLPDRVSLAELSRTLADLGQALMVAGVVLSLVCPPAAAAVWAAVAVVAVCQLVTDAARRQRGEHVGMAALGWDAMAVFPVGRLAAKARTAAEASKAIERLAPELRSSRLVPGGGLAAHEGTASYRGHTLLKHVGKTGEELAQRFTNEPNLKRSSSFTDRAVAEAAIARTLADSRQAVAEWLRDPDTPLVLYGDIGQPIGKSVARDGTVVGASRLRIVLNPERTDLGFYVRTAYPIP